MLRALFAEPESCGRSRTRSQITRDGRRPRSRIAESLRKLEVDDSAVAHFLTKLLFCMFAEDVGLLPEGHVLGRLRARRTAERRRDSRSGSASAELFAAMAHGRPVRRSRTIPQFNGGLFADADVLDA